jgi:hypothetical protein
MDKQKDVLTRKQARTDISMALASLTDLRTAIGEKKYKRRLAKVESILTKGLPKKVKKTKLTPIESTSAA